MIASSPFGVACVSFPIALALALGGCLSAGGDELTSAAEGAEQNSLVEGWSASRTLTDADRVVEAGDRDNDAVSDPPLYSVSWPGGAGARNMHEELYGSIRGVSVSVDIDYPRADGVGIWLHAGDKHVQLRSPDYYSRARASFRQTFTTAELSEQRAFGEFSLEIAGTELAVARDCYSEVNASSSSVSATSNGIFRSSSYRASESDYSSQRRCQEFFRPLHVRRVEIKIDYDVPPVTMPTREWTIEEPRTLYTNNIDHYDVTVGSEGAPPYIMSGIKVDILVWYPRTLGGTLRIELRGPAGIVNLWSSNEDSRAEGDDYITLQTPVHDLDERRMDGEWKLSFVHQNTQASSAGPGITYELQHARIVFNPQDRPPVTWRTQQVDFASNHPFYLGTVLNFDVVAPADALACRFGFDHLELGTGNLSIRSPDGELLVRMPRSDSGGGTLSVPVSGQRFVLRFDTIGSVIPSWGFHMNELTCKF